MSVVWGLNLERKGGGNFISMWAEATAARPKMVESVVNFMVTAELTC